MILFFLLYIYDRVLDRYSVGAKIEHSLLMNL